MAQQTAVEWLFAQIPLEFSSSRSAYEKLEKALHMEKEQITNTYLNACARVTPYGNYTDSAEEYYNETYKK